MITRDRLFQVIFPQRDKKIIYPAISQPIEISFCIRILRAIESDFQSVCKKHKKNGLNQKSLSKNVNGIFLGNFILKGIDWSLLCFIIRENKYCFISQDLLK